MLRWNFLRAPYSTRTLNREIGKLRVSNFRNLNFPSSLKEQFEQDTSKARSQRLWVEGLTAIVALNGCLLLDSMMVKDIMWAEIGRRTLIISPLALAVSVLMRSNPRRWLREGGVAVGMMLICIINLYMQGSSTAAKASFGLICALMMALFVNVTMRLRYWYATMVTSVMLAAGLWFAYHAGGLDPSERTLGASLITIGFTMTLMAGYSLEREERISYLLFQSSRLQGEELHRLSSIDKLSGLPNRWALEERFEEYWAAAIKTAKPLSAVVIDIDHFKVVNDVYGHLYGDAVLRRIADALAEGLRTPTDFAAPFGGEEFVILLPDTDKEMALGVAERIRRLVETTGMPVPEQMSDDQMLWTTVSCGVSTCTPEQGMSRERLLKLADRALYRAKENGRNRVEFRSWQHAPSGMRSVVGRTSSGMRLAEKLRSQESSIRPVAPTT